LRTGRSNQTSHECALRAGAKEAHRFRSFEETPTKGLDIGSRSGQLRKSYPSSKLFTRGNSSMVSFWCSPLGMVNGELFLRRLRFRQRRLWWILALLMPCPINKSWLRNAIWMIRLGFVRACLFRTDCLPDQPSSSRS
jgi:hypothetical protein